MENILSVVKENIQKVLVGQERVTSLLLTALVAGGHVLIEDVPGMGKTVLARSLAGCSSPRTCCPPTLPA